MFIFSSSKKKKEEAKKKRGDYQTDDWKWFLQDIKTQVASQMKPDENEVQRWHAQQQLDMAIARGDIALADAIAAEQQRRYEEDHPELSDRPRSNSAPTASYGTFVAPNSQDNSRQSSPRSAMTANGQPVYSTAGRDGGSPVVGSPHCSSTHGTPLHTKMGSRKTSSPNLSVTVHGSINSSNAFSREEDGEELMPIVSTTR